MSLIAKLLVSFVVAIIASTLTTIMLTGELLDLRLLVAFFFATAATAMIVRDSSNAVSNAPATTAQPPTHSDTGREHGVVKWFNISKGFGFIVRDNGDEIFVHFRSIRGEGRRGLRDGQKVSFIVAESEKGPQAEDVVGET